MKILHTSDWHLGHTLYGIDRKEEQVNMLKQIVEIAKKETPDAFLLSGDVYDNAQPSAAAQEMFSDTMASLREAVPDMAIIVTAGNHDSGSRHEAFQSLLNKLGIHAIGTLDKTQPQNHIIELTGKGYIIALPYAHEQYIPDGYYDSLNNMIEEKNINNLPVVMMAHTTVKNADYHGHTNNASDKIIGGIEGIDVDCLGNGYDYLALGHIHRPQTMGVKGSNRLIRYCGTPIATSFDEDYYEGTNKNKETHSVSMVEITKRGDKPTIKTIEIRNPYPLVTLPTDEPKTWDEVKTIFSNYPSDLKTYIRLNVAITDSLPSMAHSEAQEIALNKSCHFCLINAVRTEKEHRANHRVMEISELQRMDPLDILKQFYNDKKGLTLPEEMEKLFMETVKELNEENREA